MNTSSIETPALVPLEKLMQRPFILGASVSANYFTESPGRRLALRHTSADQIKTVAKNGTPGKTLLQGLRDEDFADRSALIGMDLFFWDSFAPAPADSLRALDRLQALSEKLKIPFVVGEIPELVPHLQKSVGALNQRLHEIGRTAWGRVLPLNQFLHQILHEGVLRYRGREYSIESLLPDGLHIAAPASEFLADRIADLLANPVRG